MALPALFTDSGSTMYGAPPTGVGGTGTVNGGGTPGGQTPGPAPSPGQQQVNNPTVQAQNALNDTTQPIMGTTITQVQETANSSAVAGIGSAFQNKWLMLAVVVVVLYLVLKP